MKIRIKGVISFPLGQLTNVFFSKFHTIISDESAVYLQLVKQIIRPIFGGNELWFLFILIY